MACDIQILSASGTRTPPSTKADTVTVGGSAQECAKLSVTISGGGQSATKVVTVGSNGNWATIFDTSGLNCTCGESLIVAAQCVDEPACFKERGFDLPCTACPYVDDINFIVQLDPYPPQLCVDEATRAIVTLTALGAPGPGRYDWDFNDGDTAMSNGPSIDHPFTFPGTYNVKVTYTPAQASCPPTSEIKTLFVPDCDDIPPAPAPTPGDGTTGPTGSTTDPVPHPDPLVPPGQARPGTDVKHDGGGKLACDALLVAAISLFLAGGLIVAIAICAKALLIGAIGGAVAALGIILFFVWWAICGKITSCDVMQKMHRMLRLIIMFGVPLALLGGGLQGLGVPINLDVMCWGAILGYLGSIAWIKDRLEDFMEEAGCPTR